ncbi:hypothetical protein ACLI4Y_16645 [Natrialbaceae archaeon A-CW3]
MNTDISIYLLVTIGIGIILFEYKRRELDFLALFSAFYFIAYVLSPLHILIGGEQFVHSNIRVVLDEFQIGSLESVLSIALLYILVACSYIVATRKVANRKLPEVKISFRFARGLIVFSLIFSVISIIIYSSQYGGIVDSIRYAGAIRSGEVEEGGSFVFFKQPTSFAYVAVILLFGLVINEDNRTKLVKILFLISILVAVVVAALRASRVAPLTVVLTCYLVAVSYNGRIYAKYLVVMGILSGIFITFSNAIFHLYRLGIDGFIDHILSTDIFDIYSSVWQQFAHMYLSLEVSIQSPEHSPRYIQDWVDGAVHVLPSTLLGIDQPGTVSHVNTYIITGEYVSVLIPGLVAFFWYSGMWVGIVLGAVLYGVAGAGISQWINYFERDPLQLGIYYSAALIWGFQFVRAGDPRILYRGQIVWIITFGILLLYMMNKNYRTNE